MLDLYALERQARARQRDVERELWKSRLISAAMGRGVVSQSRPLHARFGLRLMELGSRLTRPFLNERPVDCCRCAAGVSLK